MQFVDLVEELHRRQNAMYSGGPVEPVRELLAEDVVWHVPGESAIAGDHRGVDAVIDYFETRRRLAAGSMRIHPGEALAGADFAVQLADGTAEIDGRTVRWSTVGVYRLENGRVAEAWLVPTNLAKFEEIWVSGRRLG
jgi:uncharacterized protein